MSVGMLIGRPKEEMPRSARDLLPELSQLHEQVVGMLIGRPKEEMPRSARDLLPELSQLHEQVRQVM